MNDADDLVSMREDPDKRVFLLRALDIHVEEGLSLPKDYFLPRWADAIIASFVDLSPASKGLPVNDFPAAESLPPDALAVFLLGGWDALRSYLEGIGPGIKAWCCPTCEGFGVKSGTTAVRCPPCGGLGRVVLHGGPKL